MDRSRSAGAASPRVMRDRIPRRRNRGSGAPATRPPLGGALVPRPRLPLRGAERAHRPRGLAAVEVVRFVELELQLLPDVRPGATLDGLGFLGREVLDAGLLAHPLLRLGHGWPPTEECVLRG